MNSDQDMLPTYILLTGLRNHDATTYVPLIAPEISKFLNKQRKARRDHSPAYGSRPDSQV
jgi:hypothetical protein